MSAELDEDGNELRRLLRPAAFGAGVSPSPQSAPPDCVPGGE